MNELRLVTKLYIMTLALAVLGLGITALTYASAPSPQRVILGFFFAGLTTVAYLFPLQFSFRAKLQLEATATLAAVLLFQPGIAMLIAGSGTFAAQIMHRKPWSETVFNSLQTMLQVAVGGLALAGMGWNVDSPVFNHPRWVLAAVLAAGAMYTVNTVCVATIVGLESRVAPVRAWYRLVANFSRGEAFAYLSELGLGILTAATAASNPWMLSLLFLPAFAIYNSLERHARHTQRAEEALLRTEASLAAAQRIARLGSIDWNLDTGQMMWSEEAYRIFGFAPQQFVPTYDTFLKAVHPEDRAYVDDAIHRALYNGEPYSLDHRVCLPDGAERIVHEQGELLLDGAGRKTRMVGAVHDITARKALEGKLAHQAFHDPLTHLPNRAFFMDRLEACLARRDRRHARVAVLFLDLDRFKYINDSLGHETGDQLLRGVAERVKSCLRPEDTAARLGGDEFTVLIENVASRRYAVGVAERITEALRAPFELGGHELYITTSIGIVLGTPGSDCVADLVRDADVAMYRAKDRGKARYEVFDESMVEVGAGRVSLEADLRRAVDRKEFVLHYQPKVELATGRIAGVEALIRWQHPQRGLVAPSEFIPLAEETGLILPLGDWVLQEACRRAALWQEQYRGNAPMMGVNLSARQLRRPELVEEVTRTLWQTGLDPGNLLIEVTESLVMEDTDASIDTLWKLKGLGVQVAIDDFGAGYSSLNYLKRLPVDMLNIDKSFVQGVGEDPWDTAIVGAVITLAETLRLRVIAEGVETEGQLTHLRALGCELAQGYYFARPMGSEAIDLLLHEKQRNEPALAGSFSHALLP